MNSYHKHKEYNKKFYREVVNPYYYLQFFNDILEQQPQPKKQRFCYIHGNFRYGTKCPFCTMERMRQKRLLHNRKYEWTSETNEKRRLAREITRERQRKIRATYKENRKWVLEQLGNKCLRCGFDNILALDIHHKNDKLKPVWWKTFQKKDYFYRWKIKGEIPKEEKENMELLCANCHRIIHGELTTD